MLPERLSTDLTSLGEGVARLALIVDMTVATDGTWGVAANWGGQLPGLQDSVTIAVPGIAVTITGPTAAQAYFLNVNDTTLNISTTRGPKRSATRPAGAWKNA